MGRLPLLHLTFRVRGERSWCASEESTRVSACYGKHIRATGTCTPAPAMHTGLESPRRGGGTMPKELNGFVQQTPYIRITKWPRWLLLRSKPPGSSCHRSSMVKHVPQKRNKPRSSLNGGQGNRCAAIFRFQSWVCASIE